MSKKHTFPGLPACRDTVGFEADIAIIGISCGTPYHSGSPSHSASAPAEIRRAAQQYTTMVAHYDFDLGGPLLDNTISI